MQADTLCISPEIESVFKTLENYNSERKYLNNTSGFSGYDVILNDRMQPDCIIVDRVMIDPEDWFKNNRSMGVIKIDNCIQSWNVKGEKLFTFGETGFDMGQALAVAFTDWQDERMESVGTKEFNEIIKDKL